MKKRNIKQKLKENLWSEHDKKYYKYTLVWLSISILLVLYEWILGHKLSYTDVLINIVLAITFLNFVFLFFIRFPKEEKTDEEDIE